MLWWQRQHGVRRRSHTVHRQKGSIASNRGMDDEIARVTLGNRGNSALDHGTGTSTMVLHAGTDKRSLPRRGASLVGSCVGMPRPMAQLNHEPFMHLFTLHPQLEQ